MNKTRKGLLKCMESFDLLFLGRLDELIKILRLRFGENPIAIDFQIRFALLPRDSELSGESKRISARFQDFRGMRRHSSCRENIGGKILPRDLIQSFLGIANFPCLILNILGILIIMVHRMRGNGKERVLAHFFHFGGFYKTGVEEF